MAEYRNSLFDAMKQISDNSVKSVKHTEFIKATIVEQLNGKDNNGNTLYSVNYLDNKFKVKRKADDDTDYKQGELVYIVLQKGELDDEDNFIFGRVNSLIKDSDSDEYEYKDDTDNLLDSIKEEKGLISYKSPYEIAIKICEDDKLEEFYNNLESKYSFGEEFRFSVCVKTSLDDYQKSTNGIYGAKLIFPTIDLHDVTGLVKENNTDEEKVIISKAEKEIDDFGFYISSESDIEGNPYRFDEYERISITKVFPKIYFKNMDKTKSPILYLYCKDFANSTEDKEVDILFKGFNLCATKKISKSKNAGYNFSIKSNDTGFLFIDSSNEVKTLSPLLYLNGSEIKAGSYTVYWFEEDLIQKNEPKDNLDFDTAGWRCLNKKDVIDNDGSFEYITKSSIDISVKENAGDIYLDGYSKKIKCVILYNDSRLEAEAIIENKKKDNGIKSFNIKKINISGSSAEVAFEATFDERVDINALNLATRAGARNNNNEIFTDIFEVAGNAATTNNKYTVYYKINLQNIGDILYVDGILYNSKTEDILGADDITLVKQNKDYYLSIINGNKNYKYDANGYSPFSQSYNSDLAQEGVDNKIPELKISILDKEGDAIPNTDYNFGDNYFTVYIPENSLFVINDNYFDKDDNNQKIREFVADRNMYCNKISVKREITYSIANTYNDDYSQNLAFIKANINGQEFDETLNITFEKEEDQSTTTHSLVAELTGCGVTLNEACAYDSKKLQLYFYNDKFYYYNYEDYELELFDDRAYYNNFYLKLYLDGELLEDYSNYNITYEMFYKNETNPCFEIFSSLEKSVKIKVKDGITLKDIYDEDKEEFISSNIIKATISAKDNTDSKVYAYYPLDILYSNLDPTAKTGDETNNFYVSIVEGYNEVVYDKTGENPSFSKSAFSLQTYNEVSLTDKYDIGNIVVIKDSIYYIGDGFFISKDKSQDYVSPVLINNNSVKNIVQGKVTVSIDSFKKDAVNAAIKELQTEIDKTEKEETNDKNFNYLIKNQIPSSYTEEKYNNALSANKEYIIKRAELINSLQTIINACNNNINNIGSNVTSVVNSAVSALTKIQNWGAAVQIETLKNNYNDINKAINDYNTKIKDFSIDNYKTNLNKFLSYISSCFVYNDITFDNNSVINYSNNYLPQQTSYEDFEKFYIQLIDNTQLNYKYSYSNGKLISKSSYSTNAYNDLLNSLESTKRSIENFNILYNKMKKEEAFFICSKPVIFRCDNGENTYYDGNKITVNNTSSSSESKKTTTYLTNTKVGYGSTNSNNEFSGILFGQKNTEVDGTKVSETGLFGYKDGDEVLSINSKTGVAKFGSEKNFQIVIDPDNTDNKVGIYYANGKFSVDGEGNLIANTIYLREDDGSTVPFVQDGIIEYSTVTKSDVDTIIAKYFNN